MILVRVLPFYEPAALKDPFTLVEASEVWVEEKLPPVLTIMYSYMQYVSLKIHREPLQDVHSSLQSWLHVHRLWIQ